MNYRQQIDAMREQLRQLAGDGASDQWAELQRLFAADTDNAAILANAAAVGGSRSLRRLLAIDAAGTAIAGPIGELRRAVGQFLRVNRFHCPEASIVFVRAVPNMPDRSIVTTSGDPASGRFLQLIEMPITYRLPMQPKEAL